jgi:hypothetical protein
MGCQSFLDYHSIYLKTDVLLLADVFEKFRKTCCDYYKLDPANYMTAPSLAWDAMLLLTDIKLELITDTKMLDMVERQKRGGLCFVGSKRYVKRITPTWRIIIPRSRTITSCIGTQIIYTAGRCRNTNLTKVSDGITISL